MIRMPYDQLVRVGLGFWTGVALAACTQATSPADRTPAAMQASAAPAGTDPPAALPASIVRALGTDERVLDCAQGTQDGVSRFQPDWVVAETTDLNGDGFNDWIVSGRHACLREGDVPAWWVYADGPGGLHVVLRATPADTLKAEDSRTAGYRDLRLRRAGADSLLKFDGAVYATPQPDATEDSATADPSGASLDTVAGRLQIKRLPGAHGREAFRVTLQGEQLVRTGDGGEFGDFPVPRVLKRYSGVAPFDEVIVFQQNMHGNACDGGPLWMLGLNRDGTRGVSNAIDYCGGKPPQITAVRDGLTIVLPGGPLNRGEGETPTETWHYRKGEAVRDPDQ